MAKSEPQGWFAPAPRIGSKKKWAPQVLAHLEAFDPDFVVVPFAGYLNELEGCEGLKCPVMVSEADPAIRQVLQSAARGSMAYNADNAAQWWMEELVQRGGLGTTRTREVIEASYRAIREQFASDKNEKGLADDTLAAWTILMSACGQSGIWRRNADGGYNIMIGQYKVQWPLGRIADRPKLEAADKWASPQEEGAKPRLRVVGDNAFKLLDKVAFQGLKFAEKGKKLAFSIDPPFGSEAGQVYMGSWVPETDADNLAGTCHNLFSQLDCIAFVWADDFVKDTFDQHFGDAITWTWEGRARKKIGKSTSAGFWYGTYGIAAEPEEQP